MRARLRILAAWACNLPFSWVVPFRSARHVTPRRGEHTGVRTSNERILFGYLFSSPRIYFRCSLAHCSPHRHRHHRRRTRRIRARHPGSPRTTDPSDQRQWRRHRVPWPQEYTMDARHIGPLGGVGGGRSSIEAAQITPGARARFWSLRVSTHSLMHPGCIE